MIFMCINNLLHSTNPFVIFFTPLGVAIVTSFNEDSNKILIEIEAWGYE